MVCKDRLTKKATWAALPDRCSSRGKRNLTPESIEEVHDEFNRRLKDGALPMADGSPAFSSLADQRGMPLGTVTHGKHEYVRQCSIILSTQHPKAKAAVLKGPAAVSARKYYFLAGDNCAEGLMGTAAQSRSRMNLNGRRTSAHAHINQLCCAYLARRPGFANVLEAYRMYRVALHV